MVLGGWWIINSKYALKLLAREVSEPYVSGKVGTFLTFPKQG